MNGVTVLVRALPWVEEPVRGEGLAMVLSGKVEVFANVVGKNNEDNDFTGAFGILYHTHYSPLPLYPSAQPVLKPNSTLTLSLI